MPVKIRKRIQHYVDITPEELNRMTRPELINALDDLSYYSKERIKRFNDAYEKFKEEIPSAPISPAYTDKSPIIHIVKDIDKIKALDIGQMRHLFRTNVNFLSTSTSTFGGYIHNLAVIRKSFYEYAGLEYKLRLSRKEIDRFFKIYKGIAGEVEEIAAGGKYETWRLIKEIMDKEEGIEPEELSRYLKGDDKDSEEGILSNLLKKIINYETAGENKFTDKERELAKLYGYTIESTRRGD